MEASHEGSAMGRGGGLRSRGGQESNGVQVETVRIAVPGQAAMTAFVVRPDGRRGNGHRLSLIHI